MVMVFLTYSGGSIFAPASRGTELSLPEVAARNPEISHHEGSFSILWRLLYVRMRLIRCYGFCSSLLVRKVYGDGRLIRINVIPSLPLGKVV